MAGAEASAWWTEVAELRERIEGRRSQQAAAPTAEPRRTLSSESGAAANVADPADSQRSERQTDVAGRRTVRIRGQAIPTVVAPRLHPSEGSGDLAEPAQRPSRARPYGTTARSSRPRPRPAERVGSNPDRLAAWAFALAVLTLLVAAISAHGL